MRQYSAWKMTSLRSAIPIGIIVGAAVMAVLPYQALYGQAAAIVQPMTGGGGPGETTGGVSTTEVPKWLMAGGSTFGLIDRDRFFKELRIEKSAVVLDLGCGRGDYTIAIAEIIGPAGRIYALDEWEEGLVQVREHASRLGLKNVRTVAADANKGIPLPDKSVDICLMASVLHGLLHQGSDGAVLRETARVLKPGGRLAVVEFKKVENGPGPSFQMRLSEKELEAVLAPFGFRTERVSDVGRYHYLLIASLGDSSDPRHTFSPYHFRPMSSLTMRYSADEAKSRKRLPPPAPIVTGQERGCDSHVRRPRFSCLTPKESRGEIESGPLRTVCREV